MCCLLFWVDVLLVGFVGLVAWRMDFVGFSVIRGCVYRGFGFGWFGVMVLLICLLVFDSFEFVFCGGWWVGCAAVLGCLGDFLRGW